jgi:hypothetical protein
MFGYGRGFGMFGGGGGGYFDDDGIDRSDWKDKSDAATRRENEAKQLFDAFIEKRKTFPSFPVTEEVIPPECHLTDPCWKTFKNYVISKGCTAKRREATPQERKASGDKRQSKMYVVSVTALGHPDNVKETMAEKKTIAVAAEEKKRQDAARKLEQERELAQKTREEYAEIVTSLAQVKSEGQEQEQNGPPTKKRKLTVPRARMINHVDMLHQSKLREISDNIAIEKLKEQQTLLRELNQRWQAREEELKKEEQIRVESIKDVF